MQSFIKNSLLIEHVENFIEKYDLLLPERKVLLGLSGGVDSMLLAHILVALKEKGFIKSVRFLHLDHGLRKESKSQAKLLKSWCDEWGWELEVTTIKDKPPQSNIEKWARKKRRHILKSALSCGEVLFLAHHIDDSFEWYLRSLLGSSQSELVMGIPLVNGLIRRPFHCLTKAQINYQIKKARIPFIVDGSNVDIRYQRNRIRGEVSPALFKIFPKGLAHYVERANQWASQFRSQEFPIDHISYGDEFRYLDLFWKKETKELSPHCEQRLKQKLAVVIKNYSQVERGEIRQNLSKVISAFVSGKNCGTFRFSGGVRVKVYPQMVLVFHESFINLLEKLWSEINTSLASDIPRQVTTLKEMRREVLKGKALPFVLYRGKSFGLKGLKEDDFLGSLVKGNPQWNIRPMSHLYAQAIKQNRLNQPFDGFCVAF